MATRNFDAVVIGAGPGGYVAAIRLAQLGKKTALVEKEALGGVCLNWGCIPSKALIAAADLVEEVRGAGERGIIAEPKVDIAKLREFKDVVVKKMTGGVGFLEKGNGVEVIKGNARFVSATIAMAKITNAINPSGKNLKMNQMPWLSCACTMPTMLSVPAHIKVPLRANPRLVS